MSLPPTTNSPIFNSSFFLGSNDFLTIAVADKRYQQIGGTGVFSSIAVAGNLDCGSLTIAGSAVDLTSLSGVTVGTVTVSKVVMVDVSKDIRSFRNLTATNLIGTFQTAAQPNITSVGPLSSLTVSGNIYGTLTTAMQPNITSVGTLSSLTVSGNISGTLATAPQPNMTSLGTITGLTSSGNITITSGGALYTTYTNNTTSSTIYQRWSNTLATNIVTDLWMSNVGSTIGTNSAHPFRIQTAGAARIYVDASGNVNIGTTAPTSTYKAQTSQRFIKMEFKWQHRLMYHISLV
ncbi:hypothetical protein AM587_10006218 [Phytophthora nicotianae]|uniref:Uncharacterized protein n=1 Tax=Phytophthora nicotianae TaxID=4792 RepID=A0A0W8CFD1_PHYNI|nr:hypothetical protein AM587_10006218 [Phytophthora nicotianae]